MQWGDMSFKGEPVSNFIAEKKSIGFKNGIPKINQLTREDR